MSVHVLKLLDPRQQQHRKARQYQPPVSLGQGLDVQENPVEWCMSTAVRAWAGCPVREDARDCLYWSQTAQQQPAQELQNG